MKKLILIGILVLAVGGGYAIASNLAKEAVNVSTSENAQATSAILQPEITKPKINETTQKVNNTDNEAKDNIKKNSNTTQDKNSTNNSILISKQDTSNTNNSSKDKYGEQFAYKLPFKINFTNNQADLERYSSMITPTFKKLYSNDYSVQINIHRIYVSYQNGKSTLTVMYTASYITNKHVLESTAVKAIAIPVSGLAITQSNPALPETWDYTSEPITIDGSIIPANTSYITLPDGSKAYYCNMVFKNFNTPTMFYTSEEDAKLNENGANINNSHLRITCINKNYAEVYNNITDQIGFVNLKNNPVVSADSNETTNIRKPLASLSEGLYNSTSFKALDAKCIGNSKYGNLKLRSYPTILSNVQATVPAGSKMVILLQGNNWSLVAYGNTLGWIPNKCILPDGLADKYNYPVVDVAPRYTKPVGYSLTVENDKYKEMWCSKVFEHALNVEFDGTGDKVTVSNLNPLVGMCHNGMEYNLTYTTPEGQTVTKNNIAINGTYQPCTSGETNYYSSKF